MRWRAHPFQMLRKRRRIRLIARNNTPLLNPQLVEMYPSCDENGSYLCPKRPEDVMRERVSHRNSLSSSRGIGGAGALLKMGPGGGAGRAGGASGSSRHLTLLSHVIKVATKIAWKCTAFTTFRRITSSV